MVTPDLSKVDLPRLQHDAVKYNEAGVYSPSANMWWQEFLRDFQEKYGSTPSVTPAWYLDELKSIRQFSSPPCNPAPNIAEKILSMHTSQTQQQKKVIIANLPLTMTQ